MKKSTLNITQYVNESLFDANRTVYGATANIHPTEGNLQRAYEALKTIPNSKTYLKEELPERFAYTLNSRIAPILVLADEGFSISNSTQKYKGNHGFDNALESMRTIFMARGPNFKKNKVIEPFRNVNIYSLLCRLLDIEGRPNNGSLDPFKDALLLDFPSSASECSSYSKALLILLFLLAFIFQY